MYDYDDLIQSTLYQFKGCFDIELSGVFLDYFRWYLHFKYLDYVIVPAPSSKENDSERGFNHVIEIFKHLRLKRKNIKDILAIKNVNLTNKKILIVDDVCTTGSTIKAMIELVKSKHPKTIKVLVMSKTIDLEKRVS